MASATRPASAFIIPIALLTVGGLDVSAALVHGSGSMTIVPQPATWAYVATAFGGTVELTAAALIAMRRPLGRLVYLTLAPLRIAAAAIATLLTYGLGLAEGNATSLLRASLPSLAIDLTIYAMLAVAMFRASFAHWLTGAAPEPIAVPAAAPAARRPWRRILVHPAAGIAAFVAVLLFMVFALDAPVALLWAGAAAIALMLGARAFLARR